jgi:5-methylcytosine-specific restriction endonuclease McrA
MDRWLEEQVWQRALGACEYCHMLQDFDEISFEIDHILPEQHGGRSVLKNLALACFACNRFKGTKSGWDRSNDGENCPPLSSAS